MRDANRKKQNDAKFDKSCMRTSVRVRIDSGIPDALQNFCNKCGISIHSFIIQAIAEKLDRCNVHSMTIAEIEKIEEGENGER